MSIQISNQKKNKNIEKIKWIFILINFILCILIHCYFNKINLFIRISLIIFLISCTIAILIYTKKGKAILAYINASKSEMQKIIWPKYKETLYTTFIIIFVTIFMSLLLWGLDSIIFRLIAFIISLRL
ncbi:preprotein translocase subunit SecE [Buchnera aphidicola (Aphis helianthi)]|uniref:Protein translocase subunit SecE n=1 Tax=Buchnera aphidicola (Aphis helianthi) TaxID=2315802 RepID=A0A4D6XID8_9GAMM|nr:preprotein translocase subunit SecE [Buchnera aphidicola]QCI16886.1 preprotein translocase subunit SecE [Buchnera aphidicola (Aphis helianthi)]